MSPTCNTVIAVENVAIFDDDVCAADIKACPELSVPDSRRALYMDSPSLERPRIRLREQFRQLKKES